MLATPVTYEMAVILETPFSITHSSTTPSHTMTLIINIKGNHDLSDSVNKNLKHKPH